MLDELTREKIALFRYGIIAPLVTGELKSEEKVKSFFRTASLKEYVNWNGVTVTLSETSLRRYYKQYTQAGFDALKPDKRADLGKSRKLDGDVISQIKFMHAEYPRLPATLIYQRLIENGTITSKDVSLSTITRYVSKLKKNNNEVKEKEFLRYELQHINEVWYGDSSVGPYITIDKKKQKTWIIALIDDASRYIVGIDIFFNDNYVNLLSVIRSAVIKHGKPGTLKFDNGSNYRSNQMELLCARMGTALHYAPPYTPTGKAKIERWFRTMKDHWMAGLNRNDFHSLDELRESLIAYVQKYNQTEHSSLNHKTPQDRFFEESHLIIRFDQERIDKTFLLEMERRVSIDNIITIDNTDYEVSSCYSNQKLLIRYAPDLSKIYSVDRETGEMAEIHLLDKHKNADGHRKNTFMMSSNGEV